MQLMPALLTSTSIRPKRSMTADVMWLTAVGSDTSPVAAIASDSETLQGTQCGARMLHVVDADGVAALRQHLGCAPAYALSRTGDERYLEFPMH